MTYPGITMATSASFPKEGNVSYTNCGVEPPYNKSKKAMRDALAADPLAFLGDHRERVCEPCGTGYANRPALQATLTKGLRYSP